MPSSKSNSKQGTGVAGLRINEVDPSSTAQLDDHSAVKDVLSPSTTYAPSESTPYQEGRPFLHSTLQDSPAAINHHQTWTMHSSKERMGNSDLPAAYHD